MAEVIKLYKILPVADGLQNWADVHRRLLAPLASPLVEITQVDLPDAPISAIGGAYDTNLVSLLQLEEALRGEKAGYDAVVMGCLDEPGVAAAKEALTIPVVGEAEAALHYASFLGRRFSFVKGDSGGRGVIEDLVRKYGFSHKLASIRTFPESPLSFAKNETPLLSRMLEQARLAVEQDGADVIIGYGSIDILQHLNQQLGVPIISPVQASVIIAESLVRLRISHSKQAFPTPATVEKLQQRGVS